MPSLDLLVLYGASDGQIDKSDGWRSNDQFMRLIEGPNSRGFSVLSSLERYYNAVYRAKIKKK